MPAASKAKERERERAAPPRHRKIGPYRVLGPLGQGGMAQVYQGLHETLQREVAIKELLPSAAADRDMLSRFRREALALASFRHQNIVGVYDLVEKNGAQFLILEYVDGPTLGQLLREGALPPAVAAVIGVQLAAALEHVHFHRIIHRDLKPANVMLTRTGEVKLMDFGIARDEDLGPLTKTGLAVGTPSYMSPEQISGAEVDARTDLYTLGVVLYECVSGKRCFTGNSPGEVLARVRDGRCPPLSKVAPDTPAALQRIIKRAMQPDPEKRHFDASALRRELEAFLASELRVSQPALLMAFLRHRNKITETEAQARLSSRELEVVKHFDAQSVSVAIELEEIVVERRSGARWAFALLLAAAAAGAVWFRAEWWPAARAFLEGLR